MPLTLSKNKFEFTSDFDRNIRTQYTSAQTIPSDDSVMVCEFTYDSDDDHHHGHMQVMFRFNGSTSTRPHHATLVVHESSGAQYDKDLEFEQRSHSSHSVYDSAIWFSSDSSIHKVQLYLGTDDSGAYVIPAGSTVDAAVTICGAAAEHEDA